jgi:site-specific recombinase
MNELPMVFDGNDPAALAAALQGQYMQVVTKWITQLDKTKADRREVQVLHHELADAKAQIRALTATTAYLTAKQLETELKCNFDNLKEVGSSLSALCRELGIKKEAIPDPRFGTVGAYHPFVCRVWCERYDYPVPTCLLTAKDPRG